MKLLTQKIINKIPKIYSQDGKNPRDINIIVKYFCPWNKWTWYAIEGEKLENGDWKFFGYVVGDFSELGYFILSELESIRGLWELKIERDLYFPKKTLADVMMGGK